MEASESVTTRIHEEAAKLDEFFPRIKDDVKRLRGEVKSHAPAEDRGVP